MPLFNPTLVRSLAVAVLLGAAGAEHLSAQRLRGRTLRSPGRGIGVRAAPPEPIALPVPAPGDTTAVGLSGVPSVRSPAAGARNYEFTLTPSVEGDNESTAYGAQVWVERNRLSAGFTGQMVHTDATGQLNPSVEGEISFELLEEKRRLGLPASLTASAAVAVTRREGNEAAATAVADVRLVGDGEERFSISLQGLGNYGVSWAMGGEVRSGPSVGVGMSLLLTRGLEAEAEYTFDSSYGEEDDWLARVLFGLPTRRFQPKLAVGAGKHGTFQVGLQLKRAAQR
jgi:hypothetical protein